MILKLIYLYSIKGTLSSMHYISTALPWIKIRQKKLMQGVVNVHFDPYFLIPVHVGHQRFLQFHWKGVSLPGPMSFVQTDLCLSSFHKDYETSSGLSKKRRIIYLDNLLVIFSTSQPLTAQIKNYSKHLD